MQHESQIIDDALKAFKNLDKTLAKTTSTQVRSVEEKQLIKASAWVWLDTTRSVLPVEVADNTTCQNLDSICKNLLLWSDVATSRRKYKDVLKEAKSHLSVVRTEVVGFHLDHFSDEVKDESLPDFSKLTSNTELISILNNRWNETTKCIEVGANLAATVMIGALLEGVFMAKALELPDKKILTSSPKAPKTKEGKPKQIRDWTLQEFIGVAHEINWIRESGKNIANVLRDYRNYIHPEKELKRKIKIEKEDVATFWAVFKSLSEQLIKN